MSPNAPTRHATVAGRDEGEGMPDAIRIALDDYGIVCANVVKGRTHPDCENMAREKVERVIRAAIAEAARDA
jgi:hypothetical protein